MTAREWLDAAAAHDPSDLTPVEHVTIAALREILDLCEEPVVFRQTTLDGYGQYDTPVTRERVRSIIERNIRAAEKP